MATKQKSTGGSIVELVVIVVVALGLALGIQAFLVKPYRIPSESMVPTLQVNQRVLVNRIGNNFTDPEVGDVMVFHPPVGAVGEGQKCAVEVSESQLCSKAVGTQADVNFIKRVVAGPGDKISVRQGRVILNGKPLDEPYAEDCAASAGCDFPGEITIPPNHWYMMGDNRDQSDDSRFWGPVPRKWFIGGAFATYWPPNRIGLL
ncbi:MAG: Signal peptidase I [uncultured Solirubrobacteraceae bacterium]|uniref:Signal peptidase I n=1 Tax=uncultured Solirubrobacteraceae bacterium TaxID=1162706 RepID=A0A6J4T4F8_9ACTN|nr:MAG: Signal peptidase I [uncultured Solirubrobacteraceae bacterium]